MCFDFVPLQSGDALLQEAASLLSALNGASGSSTRQGQVLEVMESEGMDTQPSEASQSSETDPQSSELERNEESTSSLSLSSERLEEGLLGNIVLPMGSAPSLSSAASVRRPGLSLPVRSASLETLQRASYPLQISHQQSETSETAGASGGSATGTNVTLVPISIASSLQNLGSSIDQDSSQLSLDSSNGSTSQGDISQLDTDFDDGLSLRISRTTSSDNSNAPLQQSGSGGASESSSSASVPSVSQQQSSGTSVIVQSSSVGRTSSSSQQRSSEDDGSGRQHGQEGSRQREGEDEEGGGSRRTGEPFIFCVSCKHFGCVIMLLK